MPVIQLAGHALGHAGQAMAPVGEAALRGAQVQAQAEQQMGFLQLRRDELQRRRTQDAMDAQASQQKRMRDDLAAYQKGMSNALQGAAELGFSPDMAGLQEALAQYRQVNPEGYAAFAGTWGMPAGVGDPSFPVVFSELTGQLTSALEADERRRVGGLLGQVMAEAEDAGYAPEDLADLQATATRDDVPFSLVAAKVDELREGARQARIRKDSVAQARSAAERIVSSLPGGVEGLVEEADRRRYAALATGTSDSPQRDLLLLEVAAGGGAKKEALGGLLAETAALAAAKARQEMWQSLPAEVAADPAKQADLLRSKIPALPGPPAPVPAGQDPIGQDPEHIPTQGGGAGLTFKASELQGLDGASRGLSASAGFLRDIAKRAGADTKDPAAIRQAAFEWMESQFPVDLNTEDGRAHARELLEQGLRADTPDRAALVALIRLKLAEAETND